MSYVRRVRQHVLPAVFGASVVALHCVVVPQIAHAKLPGSIHCYNEICHRVRTVGETDSRRGIVEPLVASFYDGPERDRFNPSYETSSGTRFEPNADDNAASPIHPDGTVLLLWSPVTRAAVVVRVNNAGPYYPGRTLDVSRGVAERLGFSHGGTMNLLTVVIAAPSEPEAHYVRGRTYPKVRGYLGKFDNIALASFAEPVARSSLFQATAQLPQQAFGSSQQILMGAAEEHFRLSELARVFEAVPAEMMAPPEVEMLSASVDADDAVHIQAVSAEAEHFPPPEAPSVKHESASLDLPLESVLGWERPSLGLR